MNRQKILDQHIQWLKEKAEENPEIREPIKKVIGQIEKLKSYGKLTLERQRQEIEAQQTLAEISKSLPRSQENNRRVVRIMEDIMVPIW